MKFKDLGLIEPILEALNAQGYTHPTPIQANSIPILLSGKDLLGCAQTGTGKTAAFAIPIIQKLCQDSRQAKGKRKIKALVVTPTRELAIQIGESFTSYGEFTDINNTVIFGGVKQGSQTSALNRGVDVLIATPGRLIDLMTQGYVSLRDVEYFVLDEADRMLDMGFIHDIKKLLAKLPAKRQSLFFSATMAPTIIELSHKILHNAQTVIVKPEQTTAEKVEQGLYLVAKKDKSKLLIHLLKTLNYNSVLIFTRTKHGADKVVKFLRNADIPSNAIHGNKSQGARQRALTDFKSGEVNALVATDIAARGIDVDGLDLVINYELPNVPETYVHRIGRTGRAAASGTALSFCELEERAYLKDIQKLISQELPIVKENPFMDFTPYDPAVHKHDPKKKAARYNHSHPPKAGKEAAKGSGKRPTKRPRTNKPGNSSEGGRANASRRRSN
jgi:ATP-dependent RNA helicase RhlE